MFIQSWYWHGDLCRSVAQRRSDNISWCCMIDGGDCFSCLFLHDLIENIIIVDSTKHKIVIFAPCWLFLIFIWQRDEERDRVFRITFIKDDHIHDLSSQRCFLQGQFRRFVWSFCWIELPLCFIAISVVSVLNLSLSSFVDSRFSSALHFIVKTFSSTSSFTVTFPNCHCKAELSS